MLVLLDNDLRKHRCRTAKGPLPARIVAATVKGTDRPPVRASWADDLRAPCPHRGARFTSGSSAPRAGHC